MIYNILRINIPTKYIMKLIHRILVVFAVLFLAGCGQNSLKAEIAFQKGAFLERLRKYDSAYPQYTKAIHLNIKYKERFFKRKIKNKRMLVSKMSDYLDAYVLQDNQAVSIKMKYSDPAKAVRSLNKIILKDPQDHYLYRNRGRAYYLNGDYPQALQDIDTVLRLKPNDANAHYHRALIYFAMGDVKAVIEHCSKAIAADSEYSKAYYVRGLAQINRWKPYEAINDFSSAIRISNRFAAAYYQRADVWCNLVYRGKEENIDPAIQDFTNVILLEPDNYKYYYSRGAVYAMYKNDYRKAVMDFTQAIELKPDYSLSYYNRAKAYYEMKEYAKSKMDFSKAEKLGFKSDPEFKQLLSQLQ